jgi:hypothetical protein
MKQFRDLELRGNVSEADRLLNEIINSLPDGWVRNLEAEQKVRRNISDHMYCVDCRATSQHPAATIFLARIDDGAWQVSNILTSTDSSLSEDEYNAVAEEFATQVLEPVLRGTRVEVKLGKTETDLEDYMNADTAAKLRTFSVTANRSTGSSHPRDQERWHAFIIAAHRGGSKMHPHVLMEWLIAQEWNPDRASDLAGEYEEGMELLRRYDAS